LDLLPDVADHLPAFLNQRARRAEIELLELIEPVLQVLEQLRGRVVQLAR
jgi:hypothetical protein